MKREEAIKLKLNEKTKVDFNEIHEDDVRSIDRMIADAEDELHRVKKQIKRYVENHTLTLNSDFVALVVNKNEVKDRIALLKQIIKDYV